MKLPIMSKVPMTIVLSTNMIFFMLPPLVSGRNDHSKQRYYLSPSHLATE